MDLSGRPKVVLHDHLDGGVRPATLVELSARHLPPRRHVDGARLAAALAAARGSLEAYLAVFSLATEVLQTPGALRRAATEAAEDLRDDGVVYAEVRLAPALHTAGGMTVDEVLDAVCATEVPGIELRWLVCALRDQGHTWAAAAAARRAAARGLPVVGVDLAGPEARWPAAAHAAALASAGLPATVHAGEADGWRSVHQAVAGCGARRVGHGVRAAEALWRPDGDDGWAGHELLAVLARRRVCLEVCPSSNVHTGVVGRPDELAVRALDAVGVPVSINPDNRTVSSTTASAELAVAARAFGWDHHRLARTQLDAAAAAFCDDATRARLVATVADGWGVRRPGR